MDKVATLKTLCGKSNIWVISDLPYVDDLFPLELFSFCWFIVCWVILDCILSIFNIVLWQSRFCYNFGGECCLSLDYVQSIQLVSNHKPPSVGYGSNVSLVFQVFEVLFGAQSMGQYGTWAMVYTVVLFSKPSLCWFGWILHMLWGGAWDFTHKL